MNAKGKTRSISMEYDLPYPAVKVWRALTEPKLVAAWLMANDMRPLVGHSFTFKDKPMPWWDGIVHCEVLELDLHKRLRYSWRAGALDTVITWTLTPTPSGGTKLAQRVAAHGWRDPRRGVGADRLRPTTMNAFASTTRKP